MKSSRTEVDIVSDAEILLMLLLLVVNKTFCYSSNKASILPVK